MGDNMMITDDPAEAKAAGEALWAVTKEAEKKMKDAQDEEERAKAEAEAGEKADDEDDEDLDDLDEEEEDEIKEGDDEEAEGHDELWGGGALFFIKHVLVLCGALCKSMLDPRN